MTEEYPGQKVGRKLSPLRHNSDGEEILDPTPMQPPLGYKKTLSLHEQIAQQVRRMKLELLRDDDVMETDEEADDFEVGDDFEPLSKYENDHIPTIKALKKKAKEINDAIAAANTKKAIAVHERKKKEAAGEPPPPPAPEAPETTAEGNT